MLQIPGHAQEQSWFPAVHHYLHPHGSPTTADPESWTTNTIHTRGLGWKSSVAKVDSPCEPKNTRVEELGANMGQGGQAVHGGTRGAAQPPSMERPSETETLVPPLNTSRSCVELPVYAHCSPRSPGVGSSTTSTSSHPNGRSEPTPALSPWGDTAPCPTGRGAAHPRAGAERRLREANQKFHLEAARGQGLGSSLRRQSEGKGGLVQPGSRDGSQFEFLPKDGQQFT